MRIIISVFFLAFFGNQLSAQNTFDSIKDSLINIDGANDQKLLEFLDNLKTFEGDDFDSLDLEILMTGPIFGSLIVGLAKDEKFRYEDLYLKFLEIKELPFYPKIRESHLITAQLESLPADYGNWEFDKELFISLGIEAEGLEEIRTFLEQNYNPNITYKELLQEFEHEQNEIDEVENREKVEALFSYKEEIDLDSLIQLCVDQNKPVLIYFTGYNCVNCRRLENSVLLDDQILNNLTENFIFISLYVDSRTLLPEDDWYKSEHSNKTVKTVGEKNIEYQISQFNTASQPFFVCLNQSNEVLGYADYYDKNVREFESFLSKCTRKFKE